MTKMTKMKTVMRQFILLVVCDRNLYLPVIFLLCCILDVYDADVDDDLDDDDDDLDDDDDEEEGNNAVPHSL